MGQDKVNYQGGDYRINRKYFSLVLPYLNNKSRVLNLGSGISFILENKIVQLYPQASVTSVDILDCKRIPPKVKYLKKSIEKPILFEEKFNVVTFFELIEHIDKTDSLLKNCAKNLKKNGILVFSFPNLSSLYCRVELLLGYQPYVLEISNETNYLGLSPLGKMNAGTKPPGCRFKEGSIHHIRGITTRAMQDLVEFHGFKVIKKFGYSNKNFIPINIFRFTTSLAPVNVFICKKI